MESEAATVGRFTTTPVLRTSMVKPRGADSEIGASEPIPFTAGDFLEFANPLDILDALGVDPSAADELRGVRSPDVRAAATLLGVILSQGGDETRAHEGDHEPKMVAEE
ncbi:hypothetical protein RHMOL_Rhmol10G0092400 [Rhododendron molle]|uniref:Uncharacterized protein n=1 Tax=Rhododendron molle TaxID=49168 RepID=A0ACC0M0M5_RHOML|nr:hypothetical protein RHMOL_Rhmol10G0092400 [Rhododendron molle]